MLNERLLRKNNYAHIFCIWSFKSCNGEPVCTWVLGRCHEFQRWNASRKCSQALHQIHCVHQWFSCHYPMQIIKIITKLYCCHTSSNSTQRLQILPFKSKEPTNSSRNRGTLKTRIASAWTGPNFISSHRYCVKSSVGNIGSFGQACNTIRWGTDTYWLKFIKFFVKVSSRSSRHGTQMNSLRPSDNIQRAYENLATTRTYRGQTVSQTHLEVATRQQLSKDQFRHVDVVLLVHDDGDSSSVVPNRHKALFTRNFHLHRYTYVYQNQHWDK